MLKSVRCKKIIVSILSVSILTVAASLLIHLDLFGPSKFYIIELESSEVLYGQIAEEAEDSITFDHIYYFNKENSAQLVSQNPRRNPPREIPRDDIFSLGVLSESSPVLKAIRKYEK